MPKYQSLDVAERGNFRLGCEQLDTQFLEIVGITGREHEIARQAGGGVQSIHRGEPAAGQPRSREQAAAHFC